MGDSWLAVPRDWLASMGEIVRFCSRIVVEVFTLKVFRFFGEGLRQAGLLILSSTLVIWGLVFIIGLECGVEGAYFDRANGVPAYAGVFSAWCDLRELVPYAFGYMMAAKVGTGIVAELGSMRISDEIDALEVIGRVLLNLLDVPEPTRSPLQRAEGHVHGDRHRARWLLLRLQRVGRTGRGRDGHGEVDGPEYRARAPHRHAGHTAVLGGQPTSTNRRLKHHGRGTQGRRDDAGERPATA